MEKVRGAVAVRSSAVAEDSADASFAGQFETFLGVDSDNLLDSVKACWASTVNARVRAYAASHGVGDAMTIAVVVQSQIDAESSGVLFTANPKSGKLGEMVVNVVSGLGEKLVAGTVTPDVYILDRKSRGIKAKTVHSKALDGDAEEIFFSEELAGELLDAGEKAEEAFGSPQDIEWAYAGGKLWLLQSRPITTLVKLPARPVPYSNYYVWTNINFAETMPYPVSPLGWSLMEHGARKIMIYNLPMTGYTPFKMFEMIYARPYWELTFMFRSKLLQKILVFLVSMLDSRVSKELARIGSEREFKVRRMFKPWTRVRFYTRAAGFVIKTVLGIISARMGIKRYEKRIRRWDLRLEKLVHEAAEFEDDWRKTLEVLEKVAFDLTRNSRDLYMPLFFTAVMFFGEYLKRWRKWIGTELDINMFSLLGDEPDMTVVCGNALRVLSITARNSSSIKVILNDAPRDKWLERLKDEPAATDFMQQLDNFIYRFGHRGPSEQDVIQPHYCDEPELALMVVRNMMNGPETPPLGVVDPGKRERDIRRVKEFLLKQRWGPRKYFEWSFFRKMLGPVIQYRENGKHILFKFFIASKRLALRAAKGLVAEGIFSEQSDVFFLTFDELLSLHKKHAIDVKTLQDTVRVRRADYNRYQGITPPIIIVSDGECVYLEPEGVGEAELRGEGVSAGVATGKARIIHDPYGDVKFEPGDILVAPQTDPGWTPLFVGAGGVVAEVGGMLSHSAVVAREYNIPAVVNVPHVTHILNDGEEITIDGTTGKIYRKDKV